MLVREKYSNEVFSLEGEVKSFNGFQEKPQHLLLNKNGYVMVTTEELENFFDEV